MPTKTQMPALEDVELQDEELLDYLKTNRADIISEFMVNRFVSRMVQEANVSVSDKELQEAADNFREAQGFITAKDTNKWLGESKLTLEQFEQWLEQSVKLAKFRDQVVKARINKYWAENATRYDSVKLSQIVCKTKAAANEIKAKMDDGEVFCVLARQYSEDAASKEAGGYLGWMRRPALASAVETQVFGAKKGGLLGPLIVGKQHVLVELHEVQKAKLENFRAEVEETVWQNWIAEKAQQS